MTDDWALFQPLHNDSHKKPLENLSKEELIEELISVEDISSKRSYLSSHFIDIIRQYEILSSELLVKTVTTCWVKELSSWRGMQFRMLNAITMNH